MTAHLSGARPVRSPLRTIARFVAVLVVLVTGFMAGAAGPASAHSAANSPSSDYVSTLTAITPATTRFSAKVIEAGSRLQVTWRSGGPLVVLGYDGEPYLRITSGGVEQNRLSPATYANAARAGTTPIPADANPDSPPEWHRISSSPVARFHDHRIHWMGSTRPPAVEAAPSKVQTIQDWTVVIRDGEAATAPTFTISGRLRWVPGPSPVVPLLGAAALALGVAALALWAGRSVPRRRLVRLPIIVLTVVLVVVDVLHLTGIVAGVKGGSPAGRFFSVGWASVAAWVMAVVAGWLLLRGREDALYLMTFAAGIITLVGGLADISVLSHTSVAFLFPVAMARWLIAVTLGLGVGIVVAAVLLTRPVHRAAVALDTPMGDQADRSDPGSPA